MVYSDTEYGNPHYNRLMSPVWHTGTHIVTADIPMWEPVVSIALMQYG